MGTSSEQGMSRDNPYIEILQILKNIHALKWYYEPKRKDESNYPHSKVEIKTNWFITERNTAHVFPKWQIFYCVNPVSRAMMP